MNATARSASTARVNGAIKMSESGGCSEIWVQVACDNGYVHSLNGPGYWCDANGSYSFHAEDCGTSGGVSSSGTGTGATGTGTNQNGGSVLILPSNSNSSVIACETPETDQFINQLYFDNILWAYQHVNIFNQLCNTLCGNNSQTNKDFIKWEIDYFKQHPDTDIQTFKANFFDGTETFFDAATTAQVVDINKMMKCFDDIPDTGATYQVKLCVDIPNNNDPTSMWEPLFNAGHVFLTMTKTNGTQSVTQSIGFYPKTTFLAATFSPTTSAIQNDGISGRQHEYNASLTLPNLSKNDFQTLVNQAKTINSTSYDLNNYNCANYVTNIINSIRGTSPINSVSITKNIYVPPASYVPLVFSESPSGLYQRLSALKNSGSPDAPNIEIGVNKIAAISKGECN